jgi:hypothetical protein
MMQRGQVFALKSGGDDRTVWAYRYRIGGRGSRRMQRGGFPTEQAAIDALERALERLRQEQGLAETPPLSELVELYIAQHDVEPETLEKLSWLLSKATRASDTGRSPSCSRLRSRLGGTSAARSATGASRTPRRAEASAPSRSKRPRSPHSTSSQQPPTHRSYSRPREADTSTCTTSATATGNQPNARSASTR